VCASEGTDYRPSDDDDGELLFTVKGAIARQQWKRHRTNWKNAKHAAFLRGCYAGAAPAGYLKDANGGLVPDGNGKAVAIREAFECRADGGSWGAVAKVLTDAAVETSHKIKGTDRKRVSWSPMGARSVVGNDIYVGNVTCTCGCGEMKEIKEWRTVDRALFLRAQRKQETKRKGAKGDGEGQMLNGLLKCATCGYGMSCDTSKHGGKVYRYWRCKANPECTAKCVISADKIEPWIVTQVLEHVGTVHGEDGGVDEARVTELRAGIKKAETDIAGLDAMLDADEVDAVTYAKANAAAIRTRDALTVELSEMEINSVATRWYVPGPGDGDYIEGGEHTTAAVFGKMPTSVKRRALSSVVSRALVAPGKGEAWDRVAVEWAA
jgi:Recombinase zinc beta ribbon domain/Recombinase